MESKYVVEVQELPRGDRSEVVQRLVQSFGVGADKAEGLLRRAPGVVTKPISQQEAQKVATLFVRAGIAAEVRPLTEATPSAVAASPAPPTPSPAAPEESASTPLPEVENTAAPEPVAPPPPPLSEEEVSVSPVEAPPEADAAAEPPAAEDAPTPDTLVEASAEAAAPTPAPPDEEEVAAQPQDEVLYPEEANPPAEGYVPRSRQGPRILLAVIILAIIAVILILWLR